jgi:hypothetical protein
MRQLRDYVEQVRRGFATSQSRQDRDHRQQDEVIYLNFSTRKLARWALTSAGLQSLQEQNAVTPAG